MEKQDCHDCKSKRSLPDNVHIKCVNPPNVIRYIGSGGEERYESAVLEAKKHNAVVRCVWPGSGMFPLDFDGYTVFGCVNREVEK